MKRIATGCALALALAAPLAVAVANTAPLGAFASAGADTHAQRWEQRQQARLEAIGDPARMAMRQMRWIERIYLRQNQPDAAQAMYRDVLTRTEDVALRNFANARLARLAVWQPRDLDAALAELRRGLDDNLARIR
jgi:hypothetical protein